MKIVAIGDTHGRAFWKLIAEREKPWDRMILIGDYFDSFDIDGETQQRNFKEICQFKEEHGDKVVLLLGNHDTSYIIGDICSGYQYGAEHNIKHLHSTYKDLTQMAHYEDDVLFTHAGVGESWLEDCVANKLDATAKLPEFNAKDVSEFVNDMWEWKPFLFAFNGRDGYGDDMGQTPVWIRPRSLMRDGQEMKKTLIQVVGHTGQRQIDIEGKATGGRYYFIDTLGTSGEYLIIEDGQFKTNKI